MWRMNTFTLMTWIWQGCSALRNFANQLPNGTENIWIWLWWLGPWWKDASKESSLSPSLCLWGKQFPTCPRFWQQKWAFTRDGFVVPAALHFCWLCLIIAYLLKLHICSWEKSSSFLLFFFYDTMCILHMARACAACWEQCSDCQY